MQVVKKETAKGKRLLTSALRYEGVYLNQVYDSWSYAKEKAWDYCYKLFCDDPTATEFSICSHNSFTFSCSWICEEGVRLETANNSYLII